MNNPWALCDRPEVTLPILFLQTERDLRKWLVENSNTVFSYYVHVIANSGMNFCATFKTGCFSVMSSMTLQADRVWIVHNVSDPNPVCLQCHRRPVRIGIGMLYLQVHDLRCRTVCFSTVFIYLSIDDPVFYCGAAASVQEARGELEWRCSCGSIVVKSGPVFRSFKTPILHHNGV